MPIGDGLEVPQADLPLHLVGAHHQRHRDIDTQRLPSCFHHQLELCRHVDRQVTGVGAIEDAVRIYCRLSEYVGEVTP